jgi:hydrogenase-4 component E
MTPLLFVFLVVLIGPLLVASWRASLLGLALQGGLLAWICLSRPWTWSTALLFCDFAAVRAILAPWLLAGAQRQLHAPQRNDMLPPNLFSWAASGALVLLAFRLAHTVIPQDGGTATQAAVTVAVAGSGVLLGLMVLATQNSLFSQIVGILRIENAIALFELGSDHEPPAVVQGVLSAIFLLTVLTLVDFLRRSASPLAETAALNEEPNL